MEHHRIFEQIPPNKYWKQSNTIAFDPLDIKSILRERLKNQLEAFNQGVDIPETEEPFNTLVQAGRLLLSTGLTVDEVLEAAFTEQKEQIIEWDKQTRTFRGELT